jgi:succinate dehydrogenase/fumarate reductase flavoprotein subunit
MNSLPVFDLIRVGDSVVGAVGFDVYNEAFLNFKAKSTVLTTGGAGELWERNNNPVSITGDGYALAFHAGCSLRDMEFVQFMPIGLADPGRPALLIAPSLADATRIRAWALP